MPTAVRVLVTLLAIGGTVGHLAYLDALWWHSLGLTAAVGRDVSPGLIVILSAHAVVSFVSALFGVALVLHEGPREAAARGLGTAFGAWAYLMAYSGVTMLMRPDPGLVQEVFEAHFLLVEMVGLAALVRFTALFPEPRHAERAAPPEALPGVLLPFHHASVWMLRPTAPWLAGGVILIVLWSWTIASGRPVADAGLSQVMNGVRLAAAGLVVLNLRRAWGMATEEERARLMWLVAGLTILAGSVTLMIGGKVLVAVAGFREPPVAWHPLLIDLGVVGFFGGLAFSVLYRGPLRAIDVVRRSATIASVGTLGLFFAAALEALLSGGVLVSFSLRTGFGSALALATVVSTYRSFVRFIERLIPLG